jgi:hypothetical protein
MDGLPAPHPPAHGESAEKYPRLFSYEQAEAKQALPLWWVNGTLYEAGPTRGCREVEAARPVICDPLVFGQLKKTIYQPRTARHERTSEREIAERSGQRAHPDSRRFGAGAGLQARTGIGLKRILQEQHAIKARDWLDASAEIENRIPIHAEDLPGDMPERVRRLWHLIPEIVSLQFNLLPLNLEKTHWCWG